MRIIIDADPIVYRAGFAGEETGYHVIGEDAHGNMREAQFWPKKSDDGKSFVTAGDQMKAWVAEHAVDVQSKERVVNPEPLPNVLHIVKQEIQSIIATCSGELAKFRGKRGQKPFPPPQVTVLLSGPNNFRVKLATLKPYKGNRDTAHKPFHYQAIRDYLTETWNAQVIEGREADDEVSILGTQAYNDKTLCVVATIDKDLDQVPGLHYDYAKQVFYDVTPEEGQLRFWEQCLSGDATDNIGGCRKIGRETAKALVALWAKDNLTDAQIWEQIVATYEHSKRLAKCPYASIPSHDVALEVARLVYMQKHPRELWNPPGIPFGETDEGSTDD